MASSTATQSSLHHDGQFVIRLPPTQRVNPEASTWLAAEEPAMRKKPAAAKRADVPRHPIVSMQVAFAESLDEIGAGTLALKPKLRTADAEARWEALLDQDKSQGPPAALWRYRPGQTCHELRKLMAQISFGVYLLLKGMANSNAQVVSILQGHIDEVDEFLEMAMEDLKVATHDLTKRLGLLRLPMDNVVVFERMLEERPFRLQIVEGNVKIEHILSRALSAQTQYACDISEGLVSTEEFSAYLAREQQGTWRKDRPDVIDIFEAMKGNTEGWLNAFADLQKQNKTLNALVLKLNATVAEMDKKAGEVSRRTRFSIQPYSSPNTSHGSTPDSPLCSPVESPTASPLPSPPPSPGAKISQSPPRLSLRFSSLHDNRVSRTSFFDLTNRGSLFMTRDTAPAAAAAAVDAAPPTTSSATPAPLVIQPTTEEIKDDRSGASSDGREEPNEDTKEGQIHEKTVEVEIREPSISSEADGDDTTEQEIEAPISIAEEARLDSPTTNALYILQPRTYTPLPPAPLPSPRLIKDTTSTEKEAAAAAPRTGDVAEFPMPPQKSRLRPAPSPTTETAAVPKAVRRVSSRAKEERQSSSPRMSSPRIEEEEPIEAAESGSVGSPQQQQQQQQRTSLRQRVSLRTTPPQSIQVPPLNTVELQRPVFASPKTFKNYKTFTGPDSAYGSDVDRSAVNSAAYYGSEVDRTAVHSSTYGSDIDRTAINSMAESTSGGTTAAASSTAADLSPPPAFPGGVVPSPQSDQQYFRPVQASPHSPLQQRPHTAGPSSRQPHQRNAPSAMGMSMLSSVTTMDSDAPGGGGKRPGGLKKKRSAFGWLKKAFTLDDEERAAFDQRKLQQTRNLYFDERSPQFLDGRRIR